MLTKPLPYQNSPYGNPRMDAVGADREEQILRYSGLVKTMALRLQARLPEQVSSDDLFTAGIIGLMDAFGKYDAAKGIPFVAYAKTRIRGAMLDEIRAMDWVPRTLRQKARELEKIGRGLEIKLGRYPHDEELADELGVSLDQYYDLLGELKAVSFLPDEIVPTTTESGESDPQNGQFETPFQNTYRQEIVAHLSQAISTLGEREQQVLSLYYIDELTMKEIGDVIGCTESRICQIHGKVVLKLRARLATQLCEDDLPCRLNLEATLNQTEVAGRPRKQNGRRGNGTNAAG